MRTRLAIVLGLLAWQPRVTHAATVTVDNLNDSGTGSLRAAILAAPPGSTTTINITATGEIDLMSTLPVGSPVAITGPGADKLTIKHLVSAFVIFSITSTVQIAGVTISDGMNGGGGTGGGIQVQAGGSLTLADSVVTGNTATTGSGIYSNGPLVIQRSTISNNTTGGTGMGPVIYAAATTSIVDSTIENNHGTAIVFVAMNAQNTLTIDRSTISGNIDGAGVGGLELQAGTANITNTTFSSNSGPMGGDLWPSGAGVTLNLVNVTATGTALALRFDNPAGKTVTLLNTLFTGPGARCSPSSSHPTSRGHNVISDITCNVGDSTDQPGVAAQLGLLTANGGATKTHLLLAHSPGLNAGGGTGLPAVDQRGFPRVQFAAADVGAVEITEPAITEQPASHDVAIGATLTLHVVAHNQNSTSPLTYQWRKDGAAIAGATSDTFTKADAQPEDSGDYDVQVGNDGGALASMPAAVTVGETSAGCCSAAGGPWSSGLLALLVSAVLGPRWRRSRSALG